MAARSRTPLVPRGLLLHPCSLRRRRLPHLPSAPWWNRLRVRARGPERTERRTQQGSREPGNVAVAVAARCACRPAHRGHCRLRRGFPVGAEERCTPLTIGRAVLPPYFHRLQTRGGPVGGDRAGWVVREDGKLHTDGWLGGPGGAELPGLVTTRDFQARPVPATPAPRGSSSSAEGLPLAYCGACWSALAPRRPSRQLSRTCTDPAALAATCGIGEPGSRAGGLVARTGAGNRASHGHLKSRRRRCRSASDRSRSPTGRNGLLALRARANAQRQALARWRCSARRTSVTGPAALTRESEVSSAVR